MVIKSELISSHSSSYFADLCPFCLGKLSSSSHIDCFPLGPIVLKKNDYALVNVSKDEPIVGRMLDLARISDTSDSFLLLYVDKVLVGFRGNVDSFFLLDSLSVNHKLILTSFIPKSQRVKKTAWISRPSSFR